MKTNRPFVFKFDHRVVKIMGYVLDTNFPSHWFANRVINQMPNKIWNRNCAKNLTD